MRARVRDLALHPAHFIDGTDTIVEAGAQMETLKSDALFVRDGGRVVWRSVVEGEGIAMRTGSFSLRVRR